MKRFLKRWQGLTALFVAFAFVFASPLLVHLFDPTAATFDPGLLHRAFLGSAVFLIATFTAWLAFQIDFPWLDRYVDSFFKRDWELIGNSQRVWFVFGVFTVLLIACLFCMTLVPVS